MTEPTTELVHVSTDSGEISMMDRATDSWTFVLGPVGELARRIAETDFVPADHRGNVGQVAAVILHGRELGLPPMTALASTHVIKGKPSLSAEAMRALILQHGHQVKIVESSTNACTITGCRAGDTDWLAVTWSADDARRAGLLPGQSGSNWAKYPRQMLAARATVELARLMFADVIHGMRAIEEMDSEPDPEPLPVLQRVTLAEIEQQAEHATQDRRSSDLPTSDDRPEPAAAPPSSAVADSPPDAGADASAPTAPASPSIDEQQAEIRHLSEVRRQLAEPVEPVYPGPEPEPEPIDTRPKKVSPGQRAAITGEFVRLDVNTPAERMGYAATLLGRDAIKAPSDLTFHDAVELLATLQGCSGRDALDALANGQTTLT